MTWTKLCLTRFALYCDYCLFQAANGFWPDGSDSATEHADTHITNTSHAHITYT
jgi:hypothetical protein